MADIAALHILHMSWSSPGYKRIWRVCGVLGEVFQQSTVC